MFPLRTSSEDTDRDANSIQLDYIGQIVFSNFGMACEASQSFFHETLHVCVFFRP